jgi:adenine phosphoribosyltransferase
MAILDELRDAVRDVPDFPKAGILFKDITPILANARLLKGAVDLFAERHEANRVDKVAAIDARGFIFGGALADRLNAGFAPIRKKGKLPWQTVGASYELEYGAAELEVHEDAFEKGDRVLLIDDLLATGGTAEASAGLIGTLGAELVELDFLIELTFLHGRDRLGAHPVFSAIQYD